MLFEYIALCVLSLVHESKLGWGDGGGGVGGLVVV